MQFFKNIIKLLKAAAKDFVEKRAIPVTREELAKGWQTLHTFRHEYETKFSEERGVI